MKEKSQALKDIYENIALSGDEKTTASDFHLRNLEISYGLEHIRDGDIVLDVGCGPAVALRSYAQERKIKAYGIDYAQNMVEFARKNLEKTAPHSDITIQQASVVGLPFEDNKFDVVTSHRCLMALLDWDLQKKALIEIQRVLKPGGVLVLMEGTVDGLNKLNFYRTKFDLLEIDPNGKDRLMTVKFDENELIKFTNSIFSLQRIQRFGMYYFITRILQPLLVAPEVPKYDHKLNEVAEKIAKIIPDFEGIGHLVGFSFRKK